MLCSLWTFKYMYSSSCLCFVSIIFSTFSNQGSHELQPILPGGTWLRFDFEDSHPVWLLTLSISSSLFCWEKQFDEVYVFLSWCQDLPTLYLQGGSIITLGPPHLHVGESSLSDDLTLLVSLDENGKFSLCLRQDKQVVICRFWLILWKHFIFPFCLHCLVKKNTPRSLEIQGMMKS